MAPPRSLTLVLLVALGFALFLAPNPAHAAPSPLADHLRPLPGARVVDAAGVPRHDLRLRTSWRGETCRLSVHNPLPHPVRVREIVVFDVPHHLAPDTPVYGEGFQMLSQTGGTLAQPRDLGGYTDRDHYRLPESPGLRTVYGLLLLSPSGQPRTLVAFTSCRRFNGAFRFNAQRLQAVLETEDLELPSGATWNLEELLVASGPDRERLLEELATRLQRHHPRLRHDPTPAGWCSWYCFGPRVTARNITDNLDIIARQFPSLRYIQIDDGYQPWMGDWLDTGKAFGGDLRGVLRQIQERGFEPALWVAPFVASEQSRLFREHPDWFVRDAHGKPLRSDRVGFGGWRLGPWYALDGTHPEALRWLEDTFRTLRRDWGCTYFKLDANYWGTLPGGHRHDPSATRIEAYRRGMEAILRGAGDALILGCNHPMWPSLGLVHASRSSLDIDRSWASFTSIGRENLLRGWQNGRLWWNDPDCVLLHDSQAVDILDPAGRPVSTSGQQPDNEYLFHATLTYATGGMVLSGDDLTRITPRRADMLRKLVPPSGQCARFADETFQLGITKERRRQVFSLLNWSDQPESRRLVLDRPSRLVDVFTGEDLGVHSDAYVVEALPPRSGRLIEALPASSRRSR